MVQSDQTCVVAVLCSSLERLNWLRILPSVGVPKSELHQWALSKFDKIRCVNHDRTPKF